jgi:hypothetical protein
MIVCRLGLFSTVRFPLLLHTPYYASEDDSLLGYSSVLSRDRPTSKFQRCILPPSSFHALVMEAILTSETSASRPHCAISHKAVIHIHRRENLTSHMYASDLTFRTVIS